MKEEGASIGAWSSIVQFVIDITRVSPNTPFQCNSSDSFNYNIFSVVKLDISRVMVLYTNGSVSNTLYTQVLTVSDTSISTGAAVKCNTTATYYIAASLLSTDKVLAVYTNTSVSGNLHAVVLTVAGHVITSTTPFKCNSVGTYYCTVVTLSTDKALVVYQNHNLTDYIYTQIFTITGTTIAVTTPVACNAVPSNNISMVLVDTNKALVCYRNRNNNYMYCMVVSVSGTTTTISTPVQCNTAVTTYITSVVLETNKVLVCYQNGSTGYNLCVVIVTITGTTVSVSSAMVCNSIITGYISGVVYAPNVVVLVYSYGTTTKSLYTQTLIVSGTVILPEAPEQFNTSNGTYSSAVSMTTGNHIFACYRNESASNYLYGQMLLMG